jgi:hypothetical protein
MIAVSQCHFVSVKEPTIQSTAGLFQITSARECNNLLPPFEIFAMNSLRSAHPTHAFRILVVAAVRLYREGMASRLEKRTDLSVVGTASQDGLVRGRQR